MAIPNPNPNIADGIKSDNKTYSSNKIESLIQSVPDVPTLTVIDKDDFFVDSTNVVNFNAVQYGKLIIINRFKLGNCSYPGTATVQANVQPAFIPASTIRFPFDEGTGTDMHVGFILDDGKLQTIGFTSPETDMNAGAFAYYIN